MVVKFWGDKMKRDIYASVQEFRTKLSLYVSRVQFGDEHIVIFKHQRPVAVMLGVDEYRELCARKKIRDGLKEAK